jgi:2-methylcitrate dehydratase PrpD
MAEMGGRAQATVIGLRDALPPPNAALANAMLCHGLDFDDTHSGALSHVTTVTGPAALAAGEARAASGRDVLTAIVAANEVVTRIGMAASGQFHARGFHPTAVCGVFGATAAAARLGGLDAERTARALGLAGSMASGLFAYLDEGTATKPLHPGWAAHGGLVAARLAALGAEGPTSVLEGRFGLFHAYLGAEPGTIDLASQLADLGSRWETPRIAYKPYPACHYMHGAVGAAATLGALDAGEIEDILVTVPPGSAVDLVLEPEAAKFAPRTPYEAKFSLPWSASELLLNGKLDSASYTAAAIAEPAVLELARKFSYRAQEFESFPGAFPGTVRIEAAGRTFEATVLHECGHEHNAMSADEVIAKFTANAGLALAQERVTAIQETVLALDRIDANGLDALASALEEARA